MQEATSKQVGAKKARLLILVLLIVLGALLLARSDFQRAPPTKAIESIGPASALTIQFTNYGNPKEELGVFHPAGDRPEDGRIFHWKDVATLERGLLAVLAEAEVGRLDGQRMEGERIAALDLVFASNHSLRIVKPEKDGALVGEIVVDRTQPNPARSGMLEVLERLMTTHAGRFSAVKIETVFLLNCGSCTDGEDHRLIDRAVTALTGQRPARILTTEGKVVPDMRHIAAGYASGLPLQIYDSLPEDESTRADLYLLIEGGGHLDFRSGTGIGLRVPTGGN